MAETSSPCRNETSGSVQAACLEQTAFAKNLLRLSEEEQKSEKEESWREIQELQVLLSQKDSLHQMNGFSDSLQAALIEQIASTTNVLKLIEEQKVHMMSLQHFQNLLCEKDALQKENEAALKKISELECEVAAKQKLKRKSTDYENEIAERDENLCDLEILIQKLIVKERQSNDELQDVRRALVVAFASTIRKGSSIGVKRMGELNYEPFKNKLNSRYDDTCSYALKLCSMWQDKLRNSKWWPFVVQLNGEDAEEVVNEEDAELCKLKEDWGHEIWMAVISALKELNEYNPRGRYAISELWNFRENRKASLKEGVVALLEIFEPQKSMRTG